MIDVDLQETGLRDLNRRLRSGSDDTNERAFRVLNPMGAHSIAVGLDASVEVVVAGHAGFYCGGMNKQADIVVEGHAGPGVAENMMSGSLRVRGNASQMAGASGHGGLLVIEGDASSRCGISMKGIDIVVAGSIGHMGAFMAQQGNLVVCGDVGEGLGDSIYEATLFVRGAADNLGADCIEKEMAPEHLETLSGLLARAEVDADPGTFRRYGSARKLYHFNVDHADSY
jgi:methylamine---glutamate N-methyltransferase subunit B